MIRTAIPTDIQRIHELHINAVRTACRGFYSMEQINGWLMNRSPEGYLKAIKDKAMYLCEFDNVIVGFGHAVVGEICAIYVDPKFHGRGIGKALLAYGLKIAAGKTGKRKVKVDSSLNAESFYAKCGFRRVREKLVKRNDQYLPVILMEYHSD